MLCQKDVAVVIPIGAASVRKCRAEEGDDGSVDGVCDVEGAGVAGNVERRHFSRAASSKRFVCPIRFTVYGEGESFRMASPMGISPLEPAMTVVILSSASFLASSPQYSMGHFLWSPRVPGTRRT